MLFSPPHKKQDVEMRNFDLSKRNNFGTSDIISEPLNLRNLCSLGEPQSSIISKSDLLSAISFDCTGDLLSVGDQGGRIMLFERFQNAQGQTEFDYLTEF